MTQTPNDTMRHEWNKSEHQETVRPFKQAVLALKWTMRLCALGLLALGYMQPEQTTSNAVSFATWREGLALRFLLLLVAVLEKDALLRWTRYVLAGGIRWYAQAAERQRDECRVHPVESGWERFWRIRSERQEAQRRWDEAQRMKEEARERRVAIVKKMAPTATAAQVDAVLELEEAFRERTTRQVAAIQEAEYRTAQEARDDVIDGVPVDEIAAYIADAGTCGIAELRAIGRTKEHRGISAKRAGDIRDCLTATDFILYSPSGAPISHERYCYVDKKNGNLATLNAHLQNARQGDRVVMLSNVLRLVLLNQPATATVRITGDAPSEHGVPYTPQAAIHVPLRTR